MDLTVIRCIYRKIIIFCWGSISMVFVGPVRNEFTSQTNNLNGVLNYEGHLESPAHSPIEFYTVIRAKISMLTSGNGSFGSTMH